MRLSLVVLSPGKWQDKVIAIKGTQFVIGRDPDCQLRPASALVSKRHCVLLVRGDKAFIRDLDSTNATILNGQMLTGELELLDEDRLKVGPLEFAVRIERPAPQLLQDTAFDDSVSAALALLGLEDTGTGGDDVPSGSTITAPPRMAPQPQKKGKSAGPRPS